jgi:MFS transporter, DHA2 family, multidrug resistance protein
MIFNFTLTNMMATYIVGDLGGSNDIASYSISFFGVGSALAIPLSKPIAERIGIARLFIGCQLLFAFLSLLCAFSMNYPTFIFFRFFQGFVTGPIFFLIHHTITVLVPAEKKDTFTSILVTLFAIVPVLGACFGGWIAYDYFWQWAFYFNIPPLLILAALMWIELKKYSFHLTKLPFDAIGYFFYFIGLLSLSLVIITGQQLDWLRSPLIVAFLILGTISFIFFILWDWDHPAPILDFKLLKHPVFSFALFNLALLFSAYFGMIILLALWLNLYADYTPIWIGVIIGTMAVTGLFPPFLIKHRFGRTDCRIPLGIAILFFAISCFHTTTFNVEIDFERIALSRVLAGFGLAFFLPPLFRLCFLSFSGETLVPVMTLFQVVRTLFGGLGAAFYTTLWQRRQVFYHDRLGGDLTPFSSETQEFFTKATEFELQGEAAVEKLNYYLDRQATSLALDDSFYLMAWITVGLLLLLIPTLFFRGNAFFPERQKK